MYLGIDLGTSGVKAMLIDDDPRGRWINVLIASNPEQSVKEAT